MWYRFLHRNFRRNILILVPVIILSWFMINLLKNGLENDTNGPIRCESEPQIVEMQLDLLSTCHKTLQMFNITHFLCYGTLWASLRHSKFFPWKPTIDLCALNENLQSIDEVYFRRAFMKRGLAVDYYAAEGLYKIWPLKHNDLTNQVKLNLFLFTKNEEFEIIRRVGFKYRLLPATSENIDSIPVRLLTLPLNEGNLNGFKFPVPRENIEIQKYHYKLDWWKEIKPKQCSTNSS